MTHKQLLKQLQLLNRDLVSADNRIWKISQKLGIPETNEIKKVIAQVEELIKIGEEKVQ